MLSTNHRILAPNVTSELAGTQLPDSLPDATRLFVRARESRLAPDAVLLDARVCRMFAWERGSRPGLRARPPDVAEAILEHGTPSGGLGGLPVAN